METIIPIAHNNWVRHLMSMFFGAFMLLSTASIAQSGNGMYNAIPINMVSTCGNYNINVYGFSYSNNNNYGNPSPDVWYSFTLNSGSSITFSTCGSGFDTYLWIVDQNGQLMASDDDRSNCGGGASEISTYLSAGTYYAIVDGSLSGSNNNSGSFSLNLTTYGAPFPGISRYQPIMLGTFYSTGANSNAQFNGSGCFYNTSGHQPSPDVWYSFELISSSLVKLSHCGSGFDTYMLLLDGNGNEIASNDNNAANSPCPGSQAYIEEVLVAGTYYVVSEGYGNNTGNIVTTINVSPPESVPVFTYAVPENFPVGGILSYLPLHTGGAPSSNTLSSVHANGLNNPLSTAVDQFSNVYVADAGNHQIKKISPSGVVSVLAGGGYPGYLDGPGASALFQRPSAVAVDISGNVYVSDQQNHSVRKISPDGSVITLAGTGSSGFNNGAGTLASFSSPMGLAVDGLGNVYVADYGNHSIRKITPAGWVSTYSGSGSAGLVNGIGTAARFHNPTGLSLDSLGNLYVADRMNHAVRKISPSLLVSTLAGNGTAGSANGVGSIARFNQVNDIAVDGEGTVYVADLLNNKVRRVSPAGVVEDLISLDSPYGIGIGADGILYVAENSIGTVRKVTTGAYSISPFKLPKGLVFNTQIGMLSGTPISNFPSTSYTVTASNAGGTGSASFTIAVSGSCLMPTLEQNYIITYIPKQPGMQDFAAVAAASCFKEQVMTNIAYLDGLGRPLQTVQLKGSPLGKDIVQPFLYDMFGREAMKYLPYTAASDNGTYQIDGIRDQLVFHHPGGMGNSGEWIVGQNRVRIPTPFSRTVFEASPLNRILEQGAPGDAWQPTENSGTDHTIRTIFGTNDDGTNGFAVRLFKVEDVVMMGRQHERILINEGLYDSSELSLIIIRDENWKDTDVKKGTVEEYKDKQDRLVLKRTFNWNDHKAQLEILSTYYVYDDLGNLSFVLTPGADPDVGVPSQTLLDNFCYQYRYDERNRLIEKRIPGKDGWELLVYNKLDQLVLTSDPTQQAKVTKEWLFTKYDIFGRVVVTGLYLDNRSRSQLQTVVYDHAIPHELRISTGDGYSNSAFPQIVGETYTIGYYDDYDFPGNTFGGAAGSQAMGIHIKTLATGLKEKILGTSMMMLSTYYYDLEGRMVQVKSQNQLGGTEVVDNDYAFPATLVATTRIHTAPAPYGGPSGNTTTIANTFAYDHMDRKTVTTSSINGAGATTLSTLHYNELGQLITKSLHNGMQATGFSYNERGWLKGSSSTEFVMNLNYQDGVHPQWNGNISQQTYNNSGVNTFVYQYDRLNRLTSGVATGMSESLRYDIMGNISWLSRVDMDGTHGGTYGYFGGNSNRLRSAGDLSMTDYDYDANGNATTDGRNGMDLTYNHMNLPATANKAGTSLVYVYNASGTKLSKNVNGLIRSYVNGIEYDGYNIDQIQTEEGGALNNGGNYIYRYNLTDHLGNVRVTFQESKLTANTVDVLERTNYLPFGKRSFAGTNVNRYLYNGKELQTELGDQYDYGARFYDPVIGRWNVIDPLAEQDRAWSPYNYARNNPIRFIDPDGMFFKEYDDEEAYKKDNPNGKLDGSDGHWLTSDRENNTGAWDKANETNIQKNNGYKEYENLDQRADFYRWFQSSTGEKGSETKWAGAAAVTVDKLKMLLWDSADVMGYSNSEIRGFVNSGNKLILDDVWGGLQKLYNGDPIHGKQAQNWDSKQLYKEQILINDSYWGLSNKSLNIIENAVKQKGILSKFTTDPPFKGSILNTNDRYKYGMKLMGY